MNGIKVRVDNQPAATLVGRRKELEELTKYLGSTSPKNVNVVGEPFIGLTSLLQYVYQEQVGRSNDGASVYVWLPMVALGRRDSTAFWSFLLNQLEQEMKRHNLSLPGDSFTSTDPSELFHLLTARIVELHQTGRADRIIFVIDNFELAIPMLTPDDITNLRGLIETNQGYFAVVLGSSKGVGNLEFEHFPEWQHGSRLAHRFEGHIPVGLLSRDEAAQLLQQENVYLEESELAANEINFLLTEVGHHPGLLKIAIQRFAEQRRSTIPYEATRLDLDTDDRVSSILRALYDHKGRTLEEQRFLRLLAEQGAVPVEPQRAILVEGLRKRGLVQLEDGQVSLFSQVFRRWIRTQTSITQPVYEHKPPVPDGLTSVEERLLKFFEANVGRIIPADELLRNVWGDYRSVSVVEKGVNRLRSKIEPDPKQPSLIYTVTGRGYVYRPNGSGKR